MRSSSLWKPDGSGCPSAPVLLTSSTSPTTAPSSPNTGPMSSERISYPRSRYTSYEQSGCLRTSTTLSISPVVRTWWRVPPTRTVIRTSSDRIALRSSDENWAKVSCPSPSTSTDAIIFSACDGLVDQPSARSAADSSMASTEPDEPESYARNAPHISSSVGGLPRIPCEKRCSPSVSTSCSVQCSAPMSSWPSCISVENSVLISRCRRSRSFLPRSLKRRVVMPSKQPTITPPTAPAIPASRTRRILLCESVSFAVGRPERAAIWSIVLPNSVPDTSETTWPKAAAVRVERPSVTPSVESM
mmetsp:Transcript_27517/g.88527  ORF Transcript_27517/g.88527 Transcript_27517/m.88527 type:complete len:302 (-) Transcript_27517:363-1268(-)